MLQGKTDESLDWEERGPGQPGDEASREYPLLSIVLGIATAIALVVLVIAAAMLVRCGSGGGGGGASAVNVAGSARRGRGGSSWRDKYTAGNSSPDLLVQIESGKLGTLVGGEKT